MYVPVLMGYSASFCRLREKQQHVQEALRTVVGIFWILSASFAEPLKGLLTACYGEADEPFADEAHSIIASWNVALLTAEQQELLMSFRT